MHCKECKKICGDNNLEFHNGAKCFRLHPKMFDWDTVGMNLWNLIQIKANKYFMLHNDKSHITLKKTTTMKYIVQTVHSSEKFPEFATALQDKNCKGLILYIRQSLKQVFAKKRKKFLSLSFKHIFF